MKNFALIEGGISHFKFVKIEHTDVVCSARYHSNIK